MADPKYAKLNSKYRKEQIPVILWKHKLEQFYIEIDDYAAKGILGAEMCNYLIDKYFVN